MQPPPGKWEKNIAFLIISPRNQNINQISMAMQIIEKSTNLL